MNTGYYFVFTLMFTLMFSLELENREGQIVQRVHLHIRILAKSKVEAIGTRPHSFNL